MDKIAKTLCTLSFLLLLAGCGTVREVAGTSDADAAARRIRRETPLAALAQPLSGHDDLTARIAVEASYGDKTLPVKGNLRMRRGEVIQMAFTALGAIEIARVEMTPDAVLVIDRLNKQYAKIRYMEIPFLEGSSVNYSLVESLLWNELFIPGTRNVSAHLDKFVLEASGTQQLIQPKEQRTLSCRFWADSNLTRLQRACLQFGSFLSDWTFSGYQLIGDTRYPSLLTATLEGSGRKASLAVTFSNINLDNKEWQTRTNLANYTQLTAAEMLSRLSFLK